MPCQERIDHLRHDGFIVTNDAREKFFAPLEFADQVRAHLAFD